MGRVIRSVRAKRDALKVWLRIAEDNRSAADEWVAEIDRAIALLSDFPSAGRIRDELGRALRSYPVGRYLIFYRPQKDGVQIVRILHGAMDLPRIFRRRKRK